MLDPTYLLDSIPHRGPHGSLRIPSVLTGNGDHGQEDLAEGRFVGDSIKGIHSGLVPGRRSDLVGVGDRAIEHLARQEQSRKAGRMKTRTTKTGTKTKKKKRKKTTTRMTIGTRMKTRMKIGKTTTVVNGNPRS